MPCKKWYDSTANFAGKYAYIYLVRGSQMKFGPYKANHAYNKFPSYTTNGAGLFG